MSKEHEEYIALADGGENWFDISSITEFILEEGSSVTLIITPLDGKQVSKLTIDLDGLPERPPKTTRLRMRVSFSSGTQLKVCVEDMGFGEFNPASDRLFPQQISLGLDNNI